MISKMSQNSKLKCLLRVNGTTGCTEASVVLLSMIQ